jgi:sugar/nucleoside kinase (ribokinase family)
MSVDVVVAVPAFLDMTFVGLEGLPGLGEERFAGDLVRSPGGGAISAIGTARLGLSTALASPLGQDPAGNMVEEMLSEEGVLVVGPRCPRTPITMVMPIEGDRAMVTYDPGVRARAADVAALAPRAVITALGQLDVVPAGARAYLSVGDDDARAFAGRLPGAASRASGLQIDEREALVLTGAGTAEDAARMIGARVPAVVVSLGGHGLLAVVDGELHEVQGFDVGHAVDSTGSSDLFVAAWAWGDQIGMPIADTLRWAGLYSALSVRVPTGAAGATPLGELMEEGARRGLPAPPPRVAP